MQFHIHAGDFPLTDALRRHVERRLHFDLARFQPLVRKIDVHLSDVNGPRGGHDKRCQVRVRLAAHADVVVEDIEADLYHAVDRALGRSARAVGRRLGRARRLARMPLRGAVPLT
jgi:ribosomal subunit interface protein